MDLAVSDTALAGLGLLDDTNRQSTPSPISCARDLSSNWSSSTGHQMNDDVVASAVGNIVALLRDVALGVVMTTCCLLTVVGNAMVLHAVRADRKLQTVS